MQLSDFKIGDEFRTEVGWWRVTDIGTRTLIAICIERVEKTTKHEDGTLTHATLTRDQADAEGWFEGPPYAVAEEVFDEYDMDAIWTRD